ncbi:hypothetical protein GMLC_38780 [Geomonas limicola]|uniref:Lipoprotein n=1 Tax=Geomonas limicola TaxID=2740186 RepID=A0A6V8NH93_9BACT|nr:alpha/beta hydrolase [Geomonas limicola]GFO70299.1 hypothetical protein GMLC_38780 [Geomonas limicola]
MIKPQQHNLGFRHLEKLVLLVVLLLCTSCGRPLAGQHATPTQQPAPPSNQTTRVPEPAPAPPAPVPATSVQQAPPQASFTLVRVFFATDRARSTSSDPYKMFSAKRGPLSFGSCEIALPLNPPEAGNASGQDTPGKTASRPALRRVVPRERTELLNQLRSALAKTGKRNLLIFVHGYNVGFADAARRTAQLSQDLNFDGVAAFFSWPSKGRSEAFSADETDVEWAQPDLKEFLKEVTLKTRVKNVYLIGHGMGNRALAKAFIYLNSERPDLARQVRELVLVAPDHNADLFRSELAPSLSAAPIRTTIYASSRDPALKAALKYQDYLRAGDSGPSQPIYEGIDTIDASRVDTSLATPSKGANRSSILSDIHRVIHDGKKAYERSGLQAVNDVSGRFWRLKKQ